MDTAKPHIVSSRLFRGEVFVVGFLVLRGEGVGGVGEHVWRIYLWQIMSIWGGMTNKIL